MPSPLETYRRYLEQTGQVDDRPDRDIIEELGGFLQDKRPDLLTAFPDFDAQYQEIRQANAPGTLEGLKNTAKTAFDRTRQALNVAGGADESDAGTIAELERKVADRPASYPWARWQETKGKDAAKVFLKDPIEILSNIITSGFAGSLPSLGAGLAGGAVGLAAGPVGAVVGAGAGAGAGSLATEYGSKYLETLREAGVDLTDEEAILAAVDDAALNERARDLGLRRGIPVAVFDAISAGLAGKFLAAAKGLKGASALRTGLAEAALQGGLGGAGEVAGAVSAGEKVSPGAVFEEVVGELGPGAVEIGAGSVRRNMARAAINDVPLGPPAPPMVPINTLRTPAAPPPPVAPVAPVRKSAATLTPEQQQARLAELQALPTPTPEEADELEVLTALVGNAAPPVAPPTPPTPEAPAAAPTETVYYRGVNPSRPAATQDRFYSISPEVAKSYAEMGEEVEGGSVESLKASELPKNIYKVESKEALAEELKIATDPTTAAFDAEVNRALREKGFEGVRYEEGTWFEGGPAEEVHIFVQDQAVDRARYDQIQQEISALTAQKVAADDSRVQALFTENEQIKNRYGGMPPGEVSGATSNATGTTAPTDQPLLSNPPSNGLAPQAGAPNTGDVRPGSGASPELGDGRAGSVLRPTTAEEATTSIDTSQGLTGGQRGVDATSPAALRFRPAEPNEHTDAEREVVTIFGNSLSKNTGEAVVFSIVEPYRGDQSDAGASAPINLERRADDLRVAFQEVFKKRVLFFRASREIQNHALSAPAFPDTILVNADAPSPFLSLVGHEFGHNLKNQRPDLWQTLTNLVTRVAPISESYVESRANYPENKRLEEYISDTIGDRFNEPIFWRELGLAAKDAGLWDKFQELVQNASAWLVQLRRRFQEHVLSRETGFPDQVDQIRDAVLEATQSFIAGRDDLQFATEAPVSPLVATSVEADHTAQLMLAASRLAQGGGKVDIFAQAFLQRTLAAELQSRIDALIEQHQGGDNPALQARIEKLQAALAAIGRVKGVTYSPFHLAVGLANVEKASMADVVVLLHEGTHGKLAQDPVMAARAIKAINRAFEKMEAELVERRKATGFVESLNGDPEELLVSLVSQELAAEGIPDSTSLATQLWQWVKDLYYRTIMAMQEAFGHEPDPQMALDWITNQMRRQLGGEFDWRFAHVFDRLRPKPMSVNVWTQTPMDVGAGTTPGGITDFFDPLTQSVRQPMVVPDSSEAILWNARFATGGRPDQTQTEAFKAWFKESAVVNESGAPLVVYKAMYPYNWREGKGNGQEITSINRSTEFPAFNKGESGIKISGFFGSKYTANRFADSGGMAAIYPVYLSFQNPLTIDGSGKFAGDVQFGESGRAFRDAVRSGEYDSVIIENTKDEGTIYVALTPEQIKSSIGNRGTFDPADPDIRFATQANPGEELSIQHDEAVQRIRGAAVNELSTLADQMFAAVQATRATLTFDQWWAEVHGGETPHQMLETVAKTFPGAETATLGGDRMTEAMNARAAVDAKVLVKGWLANVAKRDAQSEESSASAEKDLIETARKTNRVEAEMRDATMHEATLSDALKRDIKELIRDTKNGLETAFASGELASAVREAENLAENDGIPTEYQNLFKRVLAGEVPIFKFIEAIAKLDLPLSDLSTPEIRKAISDNAESDETLLELTTPKNKPLLVALSALVRRNYEQVDLLLLRRAEQKQFLAIHGDLKAIREASEDQLQELARTFRDAKKAATFADRLKRSFVEKRTRLRKQQRTIQTAETRRESLAQARAALVQKIDEIETSTVPQPSEWRVSEGATYLAMRQDSEGRWVGEEKKVHFTPEGPAVNPGEIISDMASNRRYLNLNPHKEGTKTYELVKRQVESLGGIDPLQTYPESRRLWFEKWLMPAGDLLLSGGGAAAARAKQMLNRWQSIVFQKQETDISVPAHEWANRLGRMTTLSGLEDNRAFLSQVYEPALAAIENNPGMDEGPALREAVKAARRRLTPDKIKEGFDEGLKDFLRRTKALSDTFAAIAKETGVFIDDDRLDGELRNAIPRGWLTAIRRMDSATVSTILIGMDAAGWKLEFKRTDPDTKAATKTSEGFRQGAIVNPGGTIVRSTAFDPLLGNSETPATPEQEAVLKDPTLLSQAIQGFFPPSVVTRWLQPFVNKPGQPLFKDVNGEPISQLTVQQAWEDAGGNIVDWIDRLLVDSTAYPTDETQETSPEADAAAWRRSMLRQIEGLYVMEAKAAADANQVRNLFDPSGKPAHMLMDARQNDLLPPEHVQHMTYDPISSKNLLATIAFHAAFGRNGEAMNRAIHEIEGGLKARVAAFQSITKRYSGTAAREDAAEAMGYKWRDLEHAAAVASQVESGAETLRASFGIGNMAGMLADVRGGLELLHFIANQTTNNPKTGLLNMLQPSQRAIARRSIGPVAIRDTARAYAQIPYDFLGGFLETFGIHLLRATDHAKNVGAMQGQGMGELPWTEVFGEGSRMGKRGEEMPVAVKAMRSLQALQRKGARIGFGKSKEFLRQGNIPFLSNTMVYMGQIAANANAAAEATSIESLVKAAMSHYEAHPGDLTNPTFRLTAKDLGAQDKAWFFDPGSFEYFRRALVEYGIGNLEQMAKEAIERGTSGQPILTKEQVAKIAVMTGNELDLQGSINTNPGVWASNPIVKFATPLIGWPIRQMAQIHDGMRDADGRASVLSVLRALGILASWSLPIGLAFTFLTDEYDDKILRKKSNLGNLDPISGLPILGPAIALTTSDLDPMDQIRSMGVRLSRAGNIYGLGADFASTVLSGMDPTSGQRQFSLDSRILAFSQIANIGQAIGNWINSGYATTYQNLERPLLQSMGGNGALQAIQIANTVLGIDNQEARITARINAGQWLRSAGREVGLEIRKSGGSSVSVTPMGAWTREMVLSALGNDRIEFLRNYERAIAAARADKKPNPEQAVLEAFRSRSPIEVFNTVPTREELDQALAAMNAGGRAAVTEALQLFDQYEQMIAPTGFEERMKRQAAARQAALTRARSGGIRRQMAVQSLSPLEERMERAAVRQQKEAALSR